MNINGNIYKWSDVSVSIAGKKIKGITAIDYGLKQTKKNLYGAGNEPVARMHGQKEYEATITLTLNELHEIESRLDKGQSIVDLEPFDIAVSYTVNGTKIVKDLISEVEFTNNKRKFTNKDDEFEVELELIPGKISINI